LERLLLERLLLERLLLLVTLLLLVRLVLIVLVVVMQPVSSLCQLQICSSRLSLLLPVLWKLPRDLPHLWDVVHLSDLMHDRSLFSDWHALGLLLLEGLLVLSPHRHLTGLLMCFLHLHLPLLGNIVYGPHLLLLLNWDILHHCDIVDFSLGDIAHFSDVVHLFHHSVLPHVVGVILIVLHRDQAVLSDVVCEGFLRDNSLVGHHWHLHGLPILRQWPLLPASLRLIADTLLPVPWHASLPLVWLQLIACRQNLSMPHSLAHFWWQGNLVGHNMRMPVKRQHGAV